MKVSKTTVLVLLSLLVAITQGRLHVPSSSSGEVFDGPISRYDEEEPLLVEAAAEEEPSAVSYEALYSTDHSASAFFPDKPQQRKLNIFGPPLVTPVRPTTPIRHNEPAVVPAPRNSPLVNPVVVRPANQVPQVEILRPTRQGKQYTQDKIVHFQAHAKDVTDGILSGYMISWEINGIYQAAGTTFSFPAAGWRTGFHEVAAYARDYKGATGPRTFFIIEILDRVTPTTFSGDTFVGFNDPFNSPPSVFITKPIPSQIFSADDRIDLHATAIDYEDGDISGGAAIHWYFTPNSVWGGNRAKSIATGGDQHIRRNTLPTGTHTLEAVARDSQGRESVPDRVVIIVTGAGIVNRPDVDILRPRQGQLFYYPFDVIPLQASVFDQDETLSSDTIQWLLDGYPITTAPALSAGSLSPGPHRIGAFAKDSTGLQSNVDSVTIYLDYIPPITTQVPPVTTTNAPPGPVTSKVPPSPITITDPVVNINGPQRGTIFLTDGYINFDASATDFEDGFLTKSSVQWRSDLDGYLGQGQRVQVDSGRLTLGLHVVTVTATDSSGRSASASTKILITEGPKVTITSPQSGRAFRDESITLQAVVTTWMGMTIPDEDIVWYTIRNAEPSWRQIAKGRRATINAQTLGRGSHEIVAVAVDGSDLGVDSVFISVNAPEQTPARASGTFPGTLNFRRNIPR